MGNQLPSLDSEGLGVGRLRHLGTRTPYPPHSPSPKGRGTVW